jgi:TIR domain/SIR2-like domain
MENLNERDWRRLLEAINGGNCVLLLGADAAFDPDDPSRTPLTLGLARKLAQSLPPNMPALVDELAHVAQLRYNVDGDRSDLELEVEEFYAPFSESSSGFHRDLAALPFTLCVITTPAHFMRNAVRAAGKSPIIEFYHYRKHRPTNFLETSARRPILYHLYGDLQELGSLVLTETDLLEFLVNVVRAAPPLPAYIAGQLADPQTSFLFLGFGFQRWYTRVLLHVLQTYGHRNRSLAVEGASFFDHPESKHTALFFEKAHKIEFRRHSWSDFAAELRRRYEAQARSPAARELPSNAPKVFLCHDSRDRERVIQLEERLHTLGIDTWRDHQNLRGGDDWDRRIAKVLREHVDYVLVLQTPNMLQRVETYVHKEIKVALERQDRFDQGACFLIPAILEPCPGLEGLSHLHRADVTTAQGLEQLAQEFHSDWTRRQRRNRAEKT